MGAVSLRRRASPYRLEVHPLDESAYEKELAACQGVTPFHSWCFLGALAAGFGLRFRAFLVTQDGVTQGVVPLLLRRRGPLSSANQLAVPYVGPVMSGGSPELLIGAMERIMIRERVVHARWEFAPGYSVDEESLQRRRYSILPDSTFILRRGASPEQRWEALQKRLRRTIGQLEASGATCEPSSREDATRLFPRLVAEPYLRQGVPPLYPQRVAEVMVERLFDHPDMRWRTTRLDDQVAAIGASVIRDRSVIFWQLAAPRVSGPSPQTLAYWDVIKWCAESDLELDFCGAPTEGIAELKRRFGPVEVPYTTALRAPVIADRLRHALAARRRAFNA